MTYQAETFTPSHLMSASEFTSASVVVPVHRSSPGAVARFEVASHHAGRLQALRRAAATAMRRGGLPDLSGQIERACLDLGHTDDVWHARLPDGTAVIVVREDLFEQLTEREIVEQVHRSEVEAALVRGETVPQETMRYYREKDMATVATPHGY